MKLVINGNEEEVVLETANITELLKTKDVSMPETVSVQLNGEFVRREDFNSTTVADGAAVDFLYFMGGG